MSSSPRIVMRGWTVDGFLRKIPRATCSGKIRRFRHARCVIASQAGARRGLPAASIRTIVVDGTPNQRETCREQAP